jgi:hypothetical protein
MEYQGVLLNQRSVDNLNLSLVKMTVIQLGPFNTPALGDTKLVFPSPSAYSSQLGAGGTKAALERGDFV